MGGATAEQPAPRPRPFNALRPTRRQKFWPKLLVDAGALSAIVGAAELTQDDTVLEIGPGLGVLTRELAAQAGQVVSVELDERLLPVLTETLTNLANVELIYGDGLTFDLSQLPENSLFVANLPYNVGTSMLVRVLESGRFKRLVFLVQKEVAERLTAGPSTSAYGALSLIVGHFGAVKNVRDVKPSSFSPPPAVTSSVVRIDTRADAAPDPQFVRLVHQAFAHRRKTLKKNLLMAGYPAEAVTRTLGHLALDARVRAEALDLETFYKLQKTLLKPT